MKRLLFAQLAVFVTATFLAVGITSAQTPTLTHYLPFDGDLSDTAGGLYGNSLWSYVDVYSPGISGNAAYFNGSDTIILLEGADVLPTSGGFTVSFWEYAETADLAPDGYFFSDAGLNPLDNLYLRRFLYPDPADPTNSTISAPNGKIANTDFGNYNPTALASGEWINHTITYNGAGQSFWYVNGQLSNYTYSGEEWTGLTTPDPEATLQYTGLTIGNRTSGSRAYQGYIDEFQIYDGTVDGGMVAYLYDNPGATLATYDAVNYPDPGLPELFPVTSVQQWTFDTDLSEANGGVTGTAINDAVVQASAGIHGGAVYFDGGDDAVSIDAAVVPTGSVSFSFWSKTDGANDGYILCDSEYIENFFARRFGTDYYNGWINYNNTFSNIGPIELDTWHHSVIISSKETGQVFWYVDGELNAEWGPVSEEMGNTILNGFLSDLYLGNRFDLARDFKGWIDDLQIYDGTLTPEDVAYLFANPGETLFESPQVAGDANGDGKVDGSDVTILAGNWQKGVDDGLTATWAEGDFNGDGKVDGSDVTILAGNWQYGVEAAASAVPEPGTIALLLAALASLLIVRRR